MLITRRTCVLSVCLLAGSVCLGQQAVKKITNEDIIAMVSLGLTDEVIVDKVHAAGATDFDTSIEGLTTLKQAKVSDAVIRAMINPNPAPASVASAPREAATPPDPNDPRSPHGSGIYWFAKQGPEKRMVRLEPSSYPGQKVSPRVGGANVKAVLPNQHAALRLTEPTPEFWFYIDEKSTGLSQTPSAATKPEDFTLARMEAKSKERQLVIGHASAFGGMTNGVRPEDAVQVDIQKVSPGIYKVSPVKPLPPGEYCFLPSGAAGSFVTYGGRLFDFGVDQTR